MPTANEYRRVALQLTSAREIVKIVLQPVAAAMDPSPFEQGGGQLERSVTATLAISSANVAGALAELQVQIDEAVRRAQVCDAYTAAVRSYRRSNDPDRRYPSRPAEWGDHG